MPNVTHWLLIPRKHYRIYDMEVANLLGEQRHSGFRLSSRWCKGGINTSTQVGHRQARSKSFRIDISFLKHVPKQQVRDIKTKLYRQTSFKNCKLQSWKISFCARHPSKTARRSCWNENVVRDILPTLQVEGVKTKLSCETSRKSDSWRGENKAFVRDFPQKLKVADVKRQLSCETSLKKWNLQMWKGSFRARLPSKSETCRCEKAAFVRDFPQKVKLADVKRQLSCETSLKKWNLQMWKGSFRARLPSKSETCLYHNEASGAQTIACATLGLCDPRGTLSPSHQSFQQPPKAAEGARRRRFAAFPPFPPEKRTLTRPGKRLVNNYGKSPSLVGNQLYFYGHFQ